MGNSTSAPPRSIAPATSTTHYIAGLGGNSGDRAENVAALSTINAAAALLAQDVSFNVAPGGLGEPGPLQYLLNTHTLERVSAHTCRRTA